MKLLVVVKVTNMILALFMAIALLSSAAHAFSPSHPQTAFLQRTTAAASSSALSMSATAPPPNNNKQPRKRKERYVPKWKKKQTLAEQMGSASTDKPDAVGLKGTISVVFRQGNATCTTMAMAGQPLRDVASQAGQFIQYGCGKGECGTCEALVNGQWVRPCVAKLPAYVPAGEDYVVQVKETKAKTVSSGKFYSARSFILGFWNNFLGMVGMVRSRRAAKNNWAERKEYEDLIMQKTLEKKRQRMAAQGNPNSSKLKP